MGYINARPNRNPIGISLLHLEATELDFGGPAGGGYHRMNQPMNSVLHVASANRKLIWNT
ncbi:MAG: hypothetical protein RL497_2151 [Pseudomonadota bacterium]|jgi:hypothetical protein